MVAAPYGHIRRHARRALPAGSFPESFFPQRAFRNRRNLGHYYLRRNGLGIQMEHQSRPYPPGSPALRGPRDAPARLARAWQYERGTGGKTPAPPTATSWADLARRWGCPRSPGHCLGVRHASPLNEYCKAHGVAFAPDAGDDGEGERPEPLLSGAARQAEGVEAPEVDLRVRGSGPGSRRPRRFRRDLQQVAPRDGRATSERCLWREQAVRLRPHDGLSCRASSAATRAARCAWNEQDCS